MCPRCGRSAFPPTDVCCTSNDSATTRSPAPTHSTPSRAPSPPPAAPASPGLRLPQRRRHALLQALLTFGCQTNGFTNRDLRALTSELRGLQPGAVTTGQTTYDLRRLKTRGLIERIPHSHRYTVTEHGLR